jgi:tetratricopeptide (TPR) repeat protein
VGGFTDLEASVALAEQINSPETPRALHNLGTMRYVEGDVEAAADLSRRAIAAAQRFGAASILNFSRGIRSLHLYRLGRWDEALTELEQFLREQTGALYAESSARIGRSWIRANRGDFAAAIADTADALATARGAGDPQAFLPAVGAYAFVLHVAGREDEAREAAAEWAAGLEQTPEYAFAVPGEIVDALGTILGAERLGALLGSTRGTELWRIAGVALAAGDFDGAIELYERAGDVTDVALVRLRAAQRLVEAGRRAEADAYLEPALAFFRSVRAMRYVREGEALLAAAS